MPLRNRPRFLVIALLTSITYTTPALAQTEEVDTEMSEVDALSLTDLLELEVTIQVASLFEERPIDSAATVELIERSSWEERGARRMTDAIDHLPSTSIYEYLYGGRGLAIRGYAGGANFGTSMLIDGVPINSFHLGSGLWTRSNIHLDTLNRIEMIRGPGSALYGSDAFFGVLSLKTFDAQNDTAKGTAAYGNDGFYRGSARVSQNLGAGLRIHTSAAYTQQDNQNTPYTYTDPLTQADSQATRKNANDSWTGNLKLTWTSPNDNTRAETSFLYNEWSATEATGAGTPNNVALLQDQDVSSVDGANFYMGRFKAEQDFGAQITAQAEGHYWRLNYDNATIVQPLLLNPEDPRTLTQVNLQTGTENTRAGGRITLRQSENTLNTRWLAGYSYSYLTINDSYQSVSLLDGTPIVPQAEAPQSGRERQLHGVLAQAETRFFDDSFRIIYGGRMDHYSDFGLQLTPRAGAIYMPTENTAIKALYGNAFRAPTANELSGNISILRGNENLKPETIDTYELILQHDQDQWDARLVGFYSKWNQAIIGTPYTAEPGFNSRYDNIGENQSYGAEANASLRFSGFRVNTSASYVFSENLTENTPYTAFPTYIVNLGTGYTIAAANLDLFVQQRVQLDTTATPNDNDQNLPAYYRLDASARWNAFGEDLAFFANVRNATRRNNRKAALLGNQNGNVDEAFSTTLGITGGY